MSFKHLNIEDREKIFLWINTGIAKKEIARRLNKTPKCIRAELKRNTKYGKKYSPNTAQKRADRVGKEQREKAPLKNTETFLYVRTKLREEEWSPEIIAGRLKIDHPGLSIDPETIYRYIYSRANRKAKLWEHLSCGRKKRRKKGGRKVRTSKIIGAVSIDRRAKYIDKRVQTGHWETDLMEGTRTSRPALSVSVERSLRLLVITKVASKEARVKTEAIVSRFKALPKHLRRTMTADNGCENSHHKVWTDKLDMKVFFCHPYHSWERGSVENAIKRIRRHFPKGSDLDEVTEEDVKRVEDALNNTPMKCLGYLTPHEKMKKLKLL